MHFYLERPYFTSYNAFLASGFIHKVNLLWFSSCHIATNNYIKCIGKTNIQKATFGIGLDLFGFAATLGKRIKVLTELHVLC